MMAPRLPSLHTNGDDDGTDAIPVSLAGDDYRAMYEVLARRFRRGLKKQAERAAADDQPAEQTEEDERVEWDLPDLFVVDGGRGQLAR